MSEANRVTFGTPVKHLIFSNRLQTSVELHAVLGGLVQANFSEVETSSQ